MIFMYGARKEGVFTVYVTGHLKEKFRTEHSDTGHVDSVPLGGKDGSDENWALEIFDRRPDDPRVKAILELCSLALGIAVNSPHLFKEKPLEAFIATRQGAWNLTLAQRETAKHQHEFLTWDRLFLTKIESMLRKGVEQLATTIRNR